MRKTKSRNCDECDVPKVYCDCWQMDGWCDPASNMNNSHFAMLLLSCFIVLFSRSDIQGSDIAPVVEGLTPRSAVLRNVYGNTSIIARVKLMILIRTRL